MHASLAAALTGGLFGSALTIAGVASPQVIMDQLQFTDFHMLLTFLSASACSVPIFAIANQRNFAKIARRGNTSYGWAGRFDGNVTGGLLLGLGMGLTGACPGTVVVQAAAGIPGSRSLLLSGLMGGVAYAKWSQSHQPKAAAITPYPQDPEKDARTELKARQSLIAYEALLFSAIIAMSLLAPRGKHLVHPVVGGILIGLAQATSVLLSRKPLGVSTAYEDVGKAFWALLQSGSLPGSQNSIFVASMFAGAATVMHLVPRAGEVVATHSTPSMFSSILGGVSLVFGARMAGGCTTGHGISGMSTLGVSSIITVFSMFGGGIVTGLYAV